MKKLILIWLLLWAWSNNTYAQTYAFVPNRGDRSISVIDMNTLSVINTIHLPAGIGTLKAVSLNPAGSMAYCTGTSNRLYIINAQTRTLVDSLVIEQAPVALASNGTGSRLYVATQQTLFVINTEATPQFVQSVLSMSPNTSIVTLNVLPAGDRVVLGNGSANPSLIFVNTATNTIANTMPLNIRPQSVCTNHNGSVIYVLGSNQVQSQSFVQAIHVASQSIATANLGAFSEGNLALSTTGQFLYVSRTIQNKVVRLKVTETPNINNDMLDISVGSSPQIMGLRAMRLLVVNKGSATVSVVNTNTNLVEQALNVGNLPNGDGGNIVPITYDLPLAIFNPNPALRPNSATQQLAVNSLFDLNLNNIQATTLTNSPAYRIQFAVWTQSLGQNITLALSNTDFELPLDTTQTWQSTPINVPLAVGALVNTDVYLRLKGGLSVGAKQANLQINLSSGGMQTMQLQGNTLLSPQAINFSLPDVSYIFNAPPINLNATATSGLQVTYSSSNPSVATLSGNVLTLIGIGLINITATQAVNNNFLPANSVTRSFRVETTITQLAHFSKEHLRFFPNPSQNGIKVQFPENILVDNTITTWVDMQGKIVANIFLNPTEQASIFTLEASHLPKGTYFVSIPIDKKAIVQKLITH